MGNEIYATPVLEVVYFDTGEPADVSASEPIGGGITLPDDNW